MAFSRRNRAQSSLLRPVSGRWWGLATTGVGVPSGYVEFHTYVWSSIFQPVASGWLSETIATLRNPRAIPEVLLWRIRYRLAFDRARISLPQPFVPPMESRQPAQATSMACHQSSPVARNGSAR